MLFRITVVQALVCAFVAVAATQIAGQGASGRIQGQVKLVLPPSGAVPSGVYPSRRVGRPQQPKPTEISNVIVYLKGVARRGDPAPMQVTITQQDEAFVPRVVAITRGSTVDFPNAGLVKVYCHIHSHMTASIMVFDHPYFRIPAAADGAFSFDDVPAGTYQISAWHERIGESTNSIRVEPGRTARVDFALPMDQQ